MCNVLESFQSFDDLRREGLKVLKDSFWERGDQLQLIVQILETSSVLGIQVRYRISNHAVDVSKLVGAEVERFHMMEVIAITGGGMETLETAKAVEVRCVGAGKIRRRKMHAVASVRKEPRFL